MANHNREQSFTRSAARAAYEYSPIGRSVKLGRWAVAGAIFAAPSAAAASVAVIGDHEPLVTQSVAVAAPESVATRTEIITFDKRDDLRFAVSTANQSVDAKSIQYTLNIGGDLIDLPLLRNGINWSYEQNALLTGVADINFFIPHSAMSGELVGDEAEVVIDASSASVESAWNRDGYHIKRYVGDDPATNDQATASEDALKSLAKFNALINLNTVDAQITEAEQGIDRRLQAEGLNMLEEHCVDDLTEPSREIVGSLMKQKMAERFDIEESDVNVAFEGEWVWSTPKQDIESTLHDTGSDGSVFYKTITTFPEISTDQVDCAISADISRNIGGGQ